MDAKSQKVVNSPNGAATSPAGYPCDFTEDHDVSKLVISSSGGSPEFDENASHEIKRLPGGDSEADILASIPEYASIRAEVESLKLKYGYQADEIVNGPDVKDKGNSDHWIPRNPCMNRLTGVHPYQGEAPLALLRHHGFLTPPTYHVIRNHGKVPQLSWHSHTIKIDGLVERPMNLTMDELVKLPKVTLPITVQCAGNRRKEQNLIKKGMGFDWGAGATSTHIWTGVLMKDVLEYVGMKSAKEGALWIDFFGPHGEVPNGDTTYGASHPRHVMLDPTRPVMLAFLQNGEVLHPDHGFPVRLLIPGYIGGRMIKWLDKIIVSSTESDTFYNLYDNRVFPPHIVSKDVATKENIWMDPLYRIDDRNLQCVCWKPNHSTKVALSETETFRVEGYAYNGAGRPVHRVEVSLNGGKSWRMATRVVEEEPTEYGRLWCWIFWHVDVPVASLAQAAEICVRAWDDSQNCMPAWPTWNLMGMMNNPWFRIKVHRVPGENAIWFEHPTRVEPTAATVYPYGETMHLVNGEVASPGWAERMQKEYSFAYMPKEKQEEVPDPISAWEVEAAHRLRGVDTTKKNRGPARKLDTISKAELAAHAADNWMAIHGLVYDCTKYLPEHPGGAAIMIPLNGKDASDEFEEAGHTTLSRKEVDRLVLKGILEGFEKNIAALQTLGWDEEDGIPTVAQLAQVRALVHGTGVKLGFDVGASTAPRTKVLAGIEHPVALDPTKKVALKLARKEQLTHDTVKYIFALPTPGHVLGLPIGQHIHLSTKMANPRTGGEQKLVSRAYTPVSNDSNVGVVEFVVKTYYKEQHHRFPDGGWLTQHMDGMKLGDTLDFRGPTGKIIYEGNGWFSINREKKHYKNIGLITGGSGVTPGYQLMKYAAQNSEPLNISMLYASVSTGDILLKSELDDLGLKGLKTKYTVDRVKDDEVWDGYVGFVNEQMIRESLPPPSDDTIVFVCGPPIMISKCLEPLCKKLGYDMVEY